MGRAKTRTLFCVPAVAIGVLSTTAAVAAISCGGVNATIETESAELAARICTLVESSVASLAECHLDVPLPLQVHVMQKLEDGCLGLYHCGTSRIDVLDPGSFASVVSSGGPFAAVPVGSYYDSIVTHELAHAAYDDRNCAFDTCPVNQEFIAFAMQVRSLSDADQARFEAWGLIEPSESQSYLTPMMLGMSPERFAAAAWWHFSTQDAPCEYVGSIVKGDVLLDRKWR
jgi:hypothetical protein